MSADPLLNSTLFWILPTPFEMVVIGVIVLLYLEFGPALDLHTLTRLELPAFLRNHSTRHVALACVALVVACGFAFRAFAG